MSQLLCVFEEFQKSNEDEILKIRWYRKDEKMFLDILCIAKNIDIKKQEVCLKKLLTKHALWWENYRDPRYVLEEWLAIRPDHILTYKFVFKRKSTDNFFVNNYFF